jgi:hypothetical protein
MTLYETTGRLAQRIQPAGNPELIAVSHSPGEYAVLGSMIIVSAKPPPAHSMHEIRKGSQQ